MATKTFSIIKGDKISDADYRDTLPVNLHAVIRQVRNATGYLKTNPGITLLGSTPGTERGGFWSERFEKHYRVCGTELVEIAADGSYTSIGEISGSDQVTFAQSYNNLVIVADGKAWYYNETDGLVQNTDSLIGEPVSVTWCDGYFMFTDGEYLYHTEISDETTFVETQYATAEFMPDVTVAVAKNQMNQVMAFGRYSTEYFYDAGNEDFAFTRIPAKAVKSGIVGPKCFTELEGTFFTLGGGKYEAISVYASVSGDTSKIATREVDKIIAEYTEEDLKTSSMESRTYHGVSYIHVNLPQHTLLYNHTIAKAMGVQYAWSLMKTSLTTDEGWLGLNGVFDPRLGKFVYGDRFNNRVGYLDDSVSTLYGDEIDFDFYSPLIPTNGMAVDQIELETIPGYTDDDTRIGVSVTEDGTIYTQEYWQLYSGLNTRNQRFILRQLGTFNNFVGFRFRGVTSARMAFGAMLLTYG